MGVVMKELSYTQEYYLCAINDKGKIRAFKSIEVSACLVISAIMELKEKEYIEADKKGILTAVKPLDNVLLYLKPIYDTIVTAKKLQTSKSIAETYLFSDKLMNALVQAIGASLVEANCTIELLKQGLLKKEIRYAPNPEYTESVIEKTREAFLKEGSLNYETVCLAALLHKSGLVNDYFSKEETGKLKLRLKEIQKSEPYAAIKEMLDFIETLIAIISII